MAHLPAADFHWCDLFFFLGTAAAAAAAHATGRRACRRGHLFSFSHRMPAPVPLHLCMCVGVFECVFERVWVMIMS